MKIVLHQIFGLPDYFITFTIGDTLQERIGNNLALPIGVVHDSTNNCEVEVCTNVIYGSVCVNVKLDYKTQDEWRKVLLLAFETYDRFGKEVIMRNLLNDYKEIKDCIYKGETYSVRDNGGGIAPFSHR